MKKNIIFLLVMTLSLSLNHLVQAADVPQGIGNNKAYKHYIGPYRTYKNNKAFAATLEGIYSWTKGYPSAKQAQEKSP